MGRTEAPPQLPDVDSRLKSIRDAQVNQAQSFRSNMPQMQQQQQSAATSAATQQLNKQKKDIAQSSQARGLFNSGIKQGKQAEAEGATGSALASRRSEINKGLQDQLGSLEGAAVESGLGVQSAEQNRKVSQYNLQREYEKSKGLFG